MLCQSFAPGNSLRSKLLRADGICVLWVTSLKAAEGSLLFGTFYAPSRGTSFLGVLPLPVRKLP